MAVVMSGIIAATAHMNEAARRRREENALAARLHPPDGEPEPNTDAEIEPTEAEKVL